MLRTRIVVPCFNEAARLDGAAFLRFGATHPAVHFLFVNDGSTDATADLLDGLCRRHADRFDVLHLDRNHGKAEAVRLGMLRVMTTGAAAAGYWDADLSTPLDAIPAFQAVLQRRRDTHIVLGTRLPLLGRRIRRKWLRQVLGRLFARCASRVVGTRVYDTQCGAKLLRISDATRWLFRDPFLSRWIFDVELLARWRQLCRASGVDAPQDALYEVPLDDWHEVGGSKLKATDFLRAIGELRAIRRRYAAALPCAPAAFDPPGFVEVPEQRAA